VAPMAELNDFPLGRPNEREGQQHRLMWFERQERENAESRRLKQREAWRFWLGIILPVATILVTVAIAMWTHGGGRP